MFFNLNESLSLQDQLVVHNNAFSMEIWYQIVLLFVAIIFIILAQHKKIKSFLVTYLKSTPNKQSYSTLYDNLTIPQLEKIVKKTSDNYRLLITVYGVLLAFVISGNLELAFSRWSLVIWGGWILAIIVRSGSFAMNLSDILEIYNIECADIKLLVARRVYASQTFLKHALYLLVPAIAFLPVIFFEQKNNVVTNFSWSPQVSILSIAVAISGVFFLLYYGGAKIQNFESKINSRDIWFYTMMLVGQMIANPVSSPLQPVGVTFFGSVFQIPLVIEITIFIGMSLGVAIPSVWLLAFIQYVRSRKKIRS